MKILAITPTYLPNIGGLEAVVEALAKNLYSQGIRMDIAHISKNNKNIREEIIDNIKIIRIPLYGNRLIGIAPALKRISNNYDLIHSHDPQVLAITLNIRIMCNKIPAVLSTHGGFHHTRKFSLLKKIYEKTFLKYSLNHYKKILASSIGDYNYFKRFSKNIELCNNGVDTNNFNKVKIRSVIKIDNWIFWGRLSNNKRIDLIIDYVKLAHDMGYKVNLLICGVDFDNILKNLENKINIHNLSNFIEIRPYLDNETLLSELNDKGVYITASEHEGFGLSIVEAMAAGLIVICRNIIPLNSFVKEHQTGFYLKFDESKEDLKLLKQILLSSNETLKNISESAKKEALIYSWETATNEFIEHYNSVLS